LPTCFLESMVEMFSNPRFFHFFKQILRCYFCTIGLRNFGYISQKMWGGGGFKGTKSNAFLKKADSSTTNLRSLYLNDTALGPKQKYIGRRWKDCRLF
jgi:hypothetical protein